MSILSKPLTIDRKFRDLMARSMCDLKHHRKPEQGPACMTCHAEAVTLANWMEDAADDYKWYAENGNDAAGHEHWG